MYLVRHGETDSNSAFRYWGKTDVGLGPCGLQQSEQLRDRLSTKKIDCIYSSDLKRTMTTARIIASVHNLPVTKCPELREIDFGQIEGLNFDEVKEKFPEVAVMWRAHDPQLAYPGGESLPNLEVRTASFIDRLEKHNANDNILIVAHSGVLRTLICQLLDMDVRHRWNMRVDLASLSVIDTYSGSAILSLLNDVSHLG